MARPRGNNGQFLSKSDITQWSIMTIIKIIVIILVLCPLVYHLLIRRQVVHMIIDLLNKEFGCQCPNGSEKDDKYFK